MGVHWGMNLVCHNLVTHLRQRGHGALAPGAAFGLFDHGVAFLGGADAVGMAVVEHECALGLLARRDRRVEYSRLSHRVPFVSTGTEKH